MKLTAMRGYSGSGKSTKAAEIAAETGAVVVNRDYLRKMLLGRWWTGVAEDEDRVTVAERAQVKALLKAGTPVVIDATHLEPRFLRKWARMASRLGVEFEVVDVHADVAECKQRDHTRMLAGGRYVSDKVIDRQAKRFPAAKWPEIRADSPFIVEPVEWIDGLPEAIIVDIDGTLAHATRSPYDYTRVMEDTLDKTVKGIVDDWHMGGPGETRCVLIVSGRDDTCYADTKKWLIVNRVVHCELWMRPTKAVDVHGGKLPDFVVKYNIFNEHIRGRYNVRFVLDDRDQVVDVWRRLGLKCLQVAEGDF